MARPDVYAYWYCTFPEYSRVCSKIKLLDDGYGVAGHRCIYLFYFSVSTSAPRRVLIDFSKILCIYGARES